MGVEWYLLVVLVSIPLKANDVEHFLASIFASNVFSLVNNLFMLLAIL